MKIRNMTWRERVLIYFACALGIIVPSIVIDGARQFPSLAREAWAGLDVPGSVPNLTPYATKDEMNTLGSKSSRTVAQAIGQIVTNTTTETAFVFDKAVVIPAGTLTPGTVLRVTQMGVYRSGLSQSVQPRIRLGPAATALTSRTVLLTTDGAVSGLLNASSDTPWGANTYHTVMPDGSIVSAGVLLFSTSLTAALNALVASVTPVSGVDPNVDNVLTASAQWTNAAAGNQIRATVFFVEIIKP